MPSQHHAGAMQLGLGGPGRNAQEPGNLFMLESLHVVHDEDLSRTGRELRYGGFKVHAQLWSRRWGRDVVPDGLAVFMPLPLETQSRAPTQDHVDRQTVKPGPESREI